MCFANIKDTETEWIFFCLVLICLQSILSVLPEPYGDYIHSIRIGKKVICYIEILKNYKDPKQNICFGRK